MPNTQYNLHLKGFVGGADFDRNYVDYVLGKHSGKPVNVLIDSLGGSVATALSITSAFKNHGDVSVHFVGMNASAATIASLGAKHISIDANAMYLVHKCSQSFFEWGALNADQFANLIADCEQIKADLDKLDCNIASMYARKCKKDSKCLLDLMKVGGWLTAKEALEWGFVDEIECKSSAESSTKRSGVLGLCRDVASIMKITDLEETSPKLTDAVAAELAAAGIPIPNLPIADRENAFAKFLAAFASLFKPKPDTAMNQETPTQEPTANAVDSRIAELEAQVAERDATIADLHKQINELKAAPGAQSTAVVEDGKKKEPTDNALSQFCHDAAEARKMFDLLH